MDWWVDWQETHRELSSVDLQFREIARDESEFLDRALEQNKDLLNYQLQSWLTFVSTEKLAELKRVSLAVCNLIRSISLLIFRNAPKALSTRSQGRPPSRACHARALRSCPPFLGGQSLFRGLGAD